MFTSLRAIGLADELAHKLAKDKGFGVASWQDLGQVRVSGKTARVNEGGRWRKVPSVYSVLLAKAFVGGRIERRNGAN